MRKRHSYEEYIMAMELLRHMGTRKASKILGIPRSTLINWRRGQKPWQAKWTPKPTKELAYILGTLMGDAYLVRDGSHYDIRLRVKDRDFAECFSTSMSKVLGKKENKVVFDPMRKMWYVKYGSKAFYTWYIKQNLETLKYYIEHSRDCVKYFLRGLYDSEGSHIVTLNKSYTDQKINLYSSNIRLLKYVKSLLFKYFKIEASGPHINRRAGSKSVKYDGSIIVSRKDRYVLKISKKRHVKLFLKEIGFGIKRKQFPGKNE